MWTDMENIVEIDFRNGFTHQDVEKTLKIIKRIQFRNNELYDFEYGIGGFVSDEYYKIKSIKLQNNDIEVIVKVSKV